jgi:hypothetical protein
LHHEVDKSQELLEFTELISLLGGLMDVEPTLTDIIEGSLDDLSKSSNPALLTSVVTDLSNGG